MRNARTTDLKAFRRQRDFAECRKSRAERQAGKHGYVHEFVRNGIENHADAALHIESSCDPTVDHIACACKKEHAECGIKQREIVSDAAECHERHENGHANDAEIRDDVGDSPDFFEVHLTDFLCHKFFSVARIRIMRMRNIIYTDYNKDFRACKQ